MGSLSFLRERRDVTLTKSGRELQAAILPCLSGAAEAFTPIVPPVGMNLFVINAMSNGIGIGQTYPAAPPFIASDIVRVAILVAFHSITMALVRLIYLRGPPGRADRSPAYSFPVSILPVPFWVHTKE